MAKIAVIAVHGVGEHKPFETARAIGDLLQDVDRPHALGAPAQPSYDPFIEREIRINVRPTLLARPGDQGPMDIRGPFHHLVNQTVAGGALTAPVDIEFMRGQLRNYHGEDPADTYETIRLEGRRVASAPNDRLVHIYEMFWSDLSNLHGGAFKIFTELYQLLFHLPSLGTHAVDAETLQHSEPKWPRFRQLHGWSAVALVAPIPVLNLFMLGIAVIVTALAWIDQMSAGRQYVLSVAVLCALAAAGLGWMLWMIRRSPWLLWMLPVVAWIAGVGYAVRETAHGVAGNARWLMVFERACVPAFVAVAIGAIIYAYNRRRPGVWKWALALVIVPILAVVLPWWPPTHTRNPVVGDWVRAFEIVYSTLVFAWACFYMVSAAALCAGVIAVGRRSSTAPERRTLVTAHLTIGISAFTFSLLTIAVWGVIAIALKKALPPLEYHAAIPYFQPVAPTIGAFMDAALSDVRIVLPALALFGAIAVLPAVWALAPVVFSEVVAPGASRATKQPYAERLGAWLDLAFSGLLLSGGLLYFAVMLVAPVLVVVRILSNQSVLLMPRQIITTLGSLSGAAFLWLFLWRGKAKDLVLGFRPVLDAMLDVDNWFREHPLERNPKSRICGRYVSLLRYICNWTDPLDPGTRYDAIVIVSHSQGTVITADLLRFVHHEARACGSMANYDGELQRLTSPGLRTFLYTMGSPLRALYGERFPRMYAWAYHLPRATDLPDPSYLGVESWTNAYRSGDYIGRHLWKDDGLASNWTVASSAVQVPGGPTRREHCIGAGAHTHYWDETAPMIARELDALIADA